MRVILISVFLLQNLSYNHKKACETFDYIQ